MKDSIAGATPVSRKQSTASSSAKRKIPIGVFDPVYYKFSPDEMLDKVSALGLEAMEIGTGGYPGTHHCPVEDLLTDPAKAKAWQKKFEDRGIHVATLSCHGNPVHPDEKHAARDAESFRRTVLLAERLGVKVIVGFSGCPGGTPTDLQPNWITYRWPPEYAQMQDWQWKEKVIPYWKEAAKFARENDWEPVSPRADERAVEQLSTLVNAKGKESVAEIRKTMQREMDAHVSVFRDGKGMKIAIGALNDLREQYQDI